MRFKREFTRRQIAIDEMKNTVASGMAIGLLIAGLEIVMLVYGIVVFDFSRLRHRLYLYAYIFMFVLGTGGFCICRFIRRTPENAVKLHALVVAFGGIILLWASCISWLDVLSGNTVIVYLTLVMGFAGGFFMFPEELLGVLLPSFVIFYAGMRTFAKAPFDGAFLMNLLIYIAVACFVSIFKYNHRIAEYRNKQETEVAKLRLSEAVETLNELNARLEKESTTDRLTGLHNRWALHERLRDAAAAEGRSAVIMIDIDKFKEINDCYGHRVGDDCLREIAETIRLSAETNEVYRFGGEEFIVLLRNASSADAVAAAERIRESVQKGIYTVERLRMTVSCGVYSAPATDARSADRFWARADEALYAAKRNGRNRTEAYTDKE